jgi:hypothetical protein
MRRSVILAADAQVICRDVHYGRIMCAEVVAERVLLSGTVRAGQTLTLTFGEICVRHSVCHKVTHCALSATASSTALLHLTSIGICNNLGS